MIEHELDINDDIELLLSAISYERQEIMNLDDFHACRESKNCERTNFHLCYSMDMKAHLQILPNRESMLLVLHPRCKMVESVLLQIIDSFEQAKDKNGKIDIAKYMSNISEQAQIGVQYYIDGK